MATASTEQAGGSCKYLNKFLKALKQLGLSIRDFFFDFFFQEEY